MQLFTTISLTSNLPHAITLTSDGAYAYVACGDGTVSVINVATNALVGTITVRSGASLTGIAAGLGAVPSSGATSAFAHALIAKYYSRLVPATT